MCSKHNNLPRSTIILNKAFHSSCGIYEHMTESDDAFVPNDKFSLWLLFFFYSYRSLCCSMLILTAANQNLLIL